MLRANLLVLALALMVASTSVAQELKIGDAAPEFTAQGVDGKEHSLKSISKDADVVVLCFTCNSCPVAVAYEDRLIEFNKQYEGKKVSFIALNCNNQTEGLEAMKERAEEKGFNFVYAFDESGSAAKNYGASVTPELFVIHDNKIAYHGSFDDKQRDPEKPYLADAVNAILAGKMPEVAETQPFGCSIKLKK